MDIMDRYGAHGIHATFENVQRIRDAAPNTHLMLLPKVFCNCRSYKESLDLMRMDVIHFTLRIVVI